MFLVRRRCHIDIAESLANMHRHSYPITQILRTLLQSTVPGGRSDVLLVAVTWFSGTSRGLSLFGPTLPSSSPGVTDFFSVLNFYLRAKVTLPPLLCTLPVRLHPESRHHINFSRSSPVCHKLPIYVQPQSVLVPPNPPASWRIREKTAISGRAQDQPILFLNATWLIFDREVIKQTGGCRVVLTIVTETPRSVHYLMPICGVAGAQRLILPIQGFARVGMSNSVCMWHTHGPLR